MRSIGRLGDEAAIAYVDARAVRWATLAGDLRFGVVTGSRDLRAVYRLRREVAVAEGWVPASAFADGLEHDAHDALAVQVAGWDGDRIVATGRLVPGTSNRSLPVESAFGMILPDRGRLVEVGRVCVAPPYREVRRGVFLGLLGQIWVEMRRRGYAEACGGVTIEMARLYAKLVGCVVVLAPPRLHWGQRRFAVRVTPTRSRAEDGKHLVGVGDPRLQED